MTLVWLARRQCGLSRHRWSVTNTARGPVCHETLSLTQERKVHLQLLFLLLIQFNMCTLLVVASFGFSEWCSCVFKHFRLLGLSLPMGNVPAIVSAIETQWLGIVAGLNYSPLSPTKQHALCFIFKQSSREEHQCILCIDMNISYFCVILNWLCICWSV